MLNPALIDLTSGTGQKDTSVIKQKGGGHER